MSKTKTKTPSRPTKSRSKSRPKTKPPAAPVYCPNAILSLSLRVRQDHLETLDRLARQFAVGITQQYVARTLMRDAAAMTRQAWEKLNALGAMLAEPEQPPGVPDPKPAAPPAEAT